ncbi:hypothetical protein J3E69DRAFT_359890 [Trichoderma sp. SZMC 28015]
MSPGLLHRPTATTRARLRQIVIVLTISCIALHPISWNAVDVIRFDFTYAVCISRICLMHPGMAICPHRRDLWRAEPVASRRYRCVIRRRIAWEYSRFPSAMDFDSSWLLNCDIALIADIGLNSGITRALAFTSFTGDATPNRYLRYGETSQLTECPSSTGKIS